MPGTDINYERTVQCTTTRQHEAHGYRPPFHDDEPVDPTVWYWCPGLAVPQQCSRPEPHSAHPYERLVQGEGFVQGQCPGREDLTKHQNPSVAWQARMERHLQDVQALTSEALRINLNHGDHNNAMLRAELAKANANAALAYAVLLSSGDLEMALSKLANPIVTLEQ